MKLPLISQGYLGRSTNMDASRMVNFYPEISPDGKSVAALIQTAGLSFFTALPSIVRGMHTFNGLIYVVAGANLYSVNNAGVVSGSLYTLSTNTGRVSMADNGLKPTGGDQLVIADGVNIYCFDVNLHTKTTSNLNAGTICFINGYFVADINTLTRGSFAISDLYNGAVWNPLNFNTADSYPDGLLTVVNSQMQLWLIGEYSTEIWYVTGLASPNIFARINGGTIECGTPAKFSVIEADNRLFWLANTKNQTSEIMGFVVNNGYSYQVISPPSINYTISEMENVTDCFAYTCTDGGHTFVFWTFPSENRTFVYDTSTGFWHERSGYQGNPYTTGRSIPNSYVNFNGEDVVSDYRNGNLYFFDENFLDDNGQPIVSMRTCQHMSDKGAGNNVFIHRLWVDAETGVGDANGSDPQIELSWSDDGGHTWSNGYTASLGKMGQYKQRLLWRRLGHSRDRIWRLIISDTCKRVLIDADMQVTAGKG